MRPDELRAKADELDDQAEKLIRAGDLLRGVPLGIEANNLRKAADQIDGLTEQTKSGKNEPMDAVNPIALQMSKGRKKSSRLVKVAQARGFTLRMLAKQVGVSHAQLSSAHKGTFAIKQSVAEHVERLIGFPATRQNWPGGWSRE